MFTKTISLLALASLLGITPVMAAESNGPQRGEGHHQAGKQMTDEQAAAIAERLADHPKVFERVDRNGDGQLSREELQGARKHLQAKKQQLDSDGDGTLSEAERAAAREQFADKRGQRDGEHRDEIIERFDTNGDGQLDEGERQAARAAVQERVAERVAKLQAEHPELFAKLDQNGDGTLDRDEMRRAKAMHQKRQQNQGGKKDK
ncbi:MAG: EF-hand domain-containing protein [Planctomycetota bacterium]|jgi:Ca2+-binding EF-hand superfamily protein|nr:EF-hand domain-containing protein [Planctomycetota bacterium]